MAAADKTLRDPSSEITIVLTTSPCVNHPSTRLIEEVLLSIGHLGGMRSCRKIIVADGAKVRTHSKYRSGVVTEEAYQKYRHYLHRLMYLTKSKKSVLFNAELLVLDERHGFGHALRRGIMRVVTPLVLVAQHDRSFVRSVPTQSIMNAIDLYKQETDDVHGIFYLGFPTGSTLEHDVYVKHRYGLEVEKRVVEQSPELSIVPLVQWFDSMHLASSDWYISKIYGRKRFCNLPRGGFIEDTLGQFMLNEIKEKGVEAHGQFGMYIVHDEEGTSMCGHLDGHDEMMQTSSSKKYSFEGEHTSEAMWEEIEEGKGITHWIDTLGDKDGFLVLTGFGNPAKERAAALERATTP
eukprot:m.345441 g.345441  ORF g.345441 m.345441 type:complete len:350 (-) comp26431_c0_seq1:15-1064(-)